MVLHQNYIILCNSLLGVYYQRRSHSISTSRDLRESLPHSEQGVRIEEIISLRANASKNQRKWTTLKIYSSTPYKISNTGSSRRAEDMPKSANCKLSNMSTDNQQIQKESTLSYYTPKQYEDERKFQAHCSFFNLSQYRVFSLLPSRHRCMPPKLPQINLPLAFYYTTFRHRSRYSSCFCLNDHRATFPIHTRII